MSESQYNSDNSETGPDPLAAILAEMSAKLEGIGRLEKKLEEATNKFTGEIDYLKRELASMVETRKLDGIEITRIQAALKTVSEDIASNV